MECEILSPYVRMKKRITGVTHRCEFKMRSLACFIHWWTSTSETKDTNSAKFWKWKQRNPFVATTWKQLFLTSIWHSLKEFHPKFKLDFQSVSSSCPHMEKSVVMILLLVPSRISTPKLFPHLFLVMITLSFIFRWLLH